MKKLINLFKKLNPDFRFLLIVIFTLPTLYLVLYLLSKVFTFISDIFFVVLGFVMGLISVIESLIPPTVSEHSALIWLIICGVLIVYSPLKIFLEVQDSRHNALRKEIQELKNRIEKIEIERR